MKRTDCADSKEMREAAAKSIKQLDLVSDAFVDRVSQMFLEKTFELEQFKASAHSPLQRTRDEAAPH
ncbi:MAG: hypothetical protein KKC76_17720 [Proteobacteria bacterium]|nr:hypothetical protein [Pseudomonadota bacterium]MBU4296152.1 hypothetical protein [Pseudomonadota bacterium]MCG2746778.1 hypothetical protein [Desulfobulbaceae bacterium]